MAALERTRRVYNVTAIVLLFQEFKPPLNDSTSDFRIDSVKSAPEIGNYSNTMTSEESLTLSAGHGCQPDQEFTLSSLKSDPEFFSSHQMGETPADLDWVSSEPFLYSCLVSCFNDEMFRHVVSEQTLSVSSRVHYMSIYELDMARI